MSRRWSVMLVALGLLLLVGTPLLWWQAQPAATAGQVPAAVIAPEHLPPLLAGAVAAGQDRAPAPDDEPAVDPEPEVGIAPATLELPSLDVTAEVDPVGLDDDGGMELPDDVARVGWYAPGVRAGEPGTTVLAGHVDSRVQGPGALFDLRRLEPGDPIVVGDGSERTTWRVTGRTRYPKDELPLDEIFRWDGPPTLVLITCGGDFVAEDGQYRDNVVVYAEPA